MRCLHSNGKCQSAILHSPVISFSYISHIYISIFQLFTNPSSLRYSVVVYVFVVHAHIVFTVRLTMHTNEFATWSSFCMSHVRAIESTKPIILIEIVTHTKIVTFHLPYLLNFCHSNCFLFGCIFFFVCFTFTPHSIGSHVQCMAEFVYI